MNKIIAFLKRLFGIKSNKDKSPAPKPVIIPVQTPDQREAPETTPIIITLPKPEPLPPDATAPVPPAVVEVPLPAPPVIVLPAVPFATLKAAGFKLGSTLKKSQIDNAKIRDFFMQQYSIITGEGIMNGKSMRKSKTTFDFTESDKIIEFAAKNKMNVYVNPLVWNANNPAYIDDLEKANKLTRDQWIAELKDYVQAPVLHNKKKYIDTGIIPRIDYAVVNEPFNVSENYAKKGELKDCVWLRKIGPEYVRLAFQFAHEADPKALLFLNEFGHEYAYKKLDSMVKFANDCKKNNIPFHGFGLQCHFGIGWGYTVQQLENNMMKLVATGAMIHLSELDVAIPDMPEGFKPADYPDKIKAQQDMYVGVFKSFLKIPKAQQYGITTWGSIDSESYNNRNSKTKDKDLPLLFDKNYKAKPVYSAILKAVS